MGKKKIRINFFSRLQSKKSTPPSLDGGILIRNIQILQIKEGKKLISEEILNLNPLLDRIITYFGNETIAIYR